MAWGCAVLIGRVGRYYNSTKMLALNCLTIRTAILNRLLSGQGTLAPESGLRLNLSTLKRENPDRL
ncbi:hypothetical protein WP1_204 [Pseudomonas phage WP1]|uniref:Uncharacterized protein n=2 Tax=Viruses TaxID=10239 RepID=A0AB39AHQ2_9VIRU